MAVQNAANAALLSAEQITLVRQHVPEEVLAVLSTKLEGDWTTKIPLISDFIHRHSPDVPTRFYGRLYFTDKFADSRAQLVTGVALSFFTATKIPGSTGISAWKIREIGFQEGRCVGHYFYRFSPDDGHGPDDRLRSHDVDEHTIPFVDRGGIVMRFDAARAHAEMSEGITRMLTDLGVADPRVRITPPPQPLPVPVPMPLPQLDQPVQPAEQPQPADRAWYLRIFDAIGDAIGSCFSGLLDCIRRLLPC